MAKSIKQIAVAEETIINKIYLLRGYKVMLDRDLAELYGVETRRLKEQVNRNLERFPRHFMFELTQEESEILRSQNATLRHGAHSKYLPYAFTEHGVLMLSNVLKSGRAIEMSIKIIDVFVKLREMLLTHKDILLKLEQLEQQVVQNSTDIQMIFTALKELLHQPREPRPRVGFRRNDEKE
ncbi:MAG TPA: ORF6N domain-containing protein [Chitinophagaceae bacterium]